MVSQCSFIVVANLQFVKIAIIFPYRFRLSLFFFYLILQPKLHIHADTYMRGNSGESKHNLYSFGI